MLFSTLLFLYVFLPVVLILSLAGNTRVKNIVLLAASLVFYAWAGVTLVIYLVASILMNYIFGLLAGSERKSRRAWFIAGIVFNLAFLLVFKYSGFFTTMLNDLAGMVWVKPPKFPVVVGISFFTFQAITYLMDVRRRISPPSKDFLNLALYFAFFPKLIAGPITRYHLMEDPLRKRTMSFGLFGEGARRFILGLARKVLIANQLALIADQAFSLPAMELTPAIAWIGLAAYAFQIYHDFGGYTDMAIGLGLMFGFRLPENFNFPYISKSVTEFWKRWHITLSEWFRDYVFLPLAYRFSGKMPKERYWIFRADQLIYLPAALVTFLLCGFWHGPAWGFVIWGGIHGLFISLERLGLGKMLKKIPPVFSHLYLLTVVTLAWVFFRTASLQDAFTYFSALFGFLNDGSTAGFVSTFNILHGIIALAAVICATRLPGQLQEAILRHGERGPSFHLWRLTGLACMVVVLFLSTFFLVNSTYTSFIYFQF